MHTLIHTPHSYTPPQLLALLPQTDQTESHYCGLADLVCWICIGYLELLHCFYKHLDTHYDVSVDKWSEFGPIWVRIALTMDDTHLLDEGTLACLSRTCEGVCCVRVCAQCHSQYTTGPRIKRAWELFLTMNYYYYHYVRNLRIIIALT